MLIQTDKTQNEMYVRKQYSSQIFLENDNDVENLPVCLWIYFMIYKIVLFFTCILLHFYFHWDALTTFITTDDPLVQCQSCTKQTMALVTFYMNADYASPQHPLQTINDKCTNFLCPLFIFNLTLWPLHFHPLEIVSRYCTGPQHQVFENDWLIFHFV